MCKKLDFPVLSLGGPRHVARVWCLGWVPKHRNQWQEVEGLLFSPKTLSWCISWAFIPRVWFPYSSFQQARQPSILSPVEEDTPKIRDTIGTVFIQGTSIVLPVWRSIMFNDSYLRSCMKLQNVQKIRFSRLESGRTKACCPSLVSWLSAKA